MSGLEKYLQFLRPEQTPLRKAGRESSRIEPNNHFFVFYFDLLSFYYPLYPVKDFNKTLLSYTSPSSGSAFSALGRENMGKQGASPQSIARPA
jgi:hypothetical protein